MSKLIENVSLNSQIMIMIQIKLGNWVEKIDIIESLLN